MKNIVNAVGFQAGWWACVAGVGYGFEITALALGAVLAVAHLVQATHKAAEAKLAFIALVLGIAVDTLLQAMGVIEFHGLALEPLSPLWLWMLWILFAMTLNFSMGFLKTKPWGLSALLGFVFGPISYVAGARLGAASLDESLVHLATLGVTWMLAMPLLVSLAKKTSGERMLFR